MLPRTYRNNALDQLEEAAANVPGVGAFTQGSAPGIQSRNWVFTLNNPTPAEITLLANHGHRIPDLRIRYIVFGYETAPTTGTPHLQGYISFDRTVRRNVVGPILGNRAHIEPMRGTPQQASDYCKKDGDFEEYGTLPVVQGSRVDLQDFIAAVRDEGPFDNRELLERFPMVVARYPRFVELVQTTYAPRPPPEMHPLRDWQQDLAIQLRLNPDPRKIIFVVDPTGNGGKSWFADYWCHIHSNAMVLLPGKYADMAYCFNQRKSVVRTVFIDCPREKLDFFNYSFLENLKDGRIFSTKYESSLKLFPRPHVVVGMNRDPDMTKLSADRYKIVRI